MTRGRTIDDPGFFGSLWSDAGTDAVRKGLRGRFAAAQVFV